MTTDQNWLQTAL